MDALNEEIDKASDRVGSDSFRVDGHMFVHYLDRKDNAHIEFLSKEKKAEILETNRVAREGDMVEIFTIDPSYCRFRNSKGNVVGRIRFADVNCTTLVFESKEIDGIKHKVDLRARFHYEGEPEVIRWMVSMKLLDKFINF